MVIISHCSVLCYLMFVFVPFLFLFFRDVREFANGSVCLECDAQCEVADDDSLTCTGPVSSVSFLL